MTEHQTLRQHLRNGAGSDDSAAAGGCRRSERSPTPAAPSPRSSPSGRWPAIWAQRQGENVDGDIQAELDLRANDLLIDELKAAPVAYVASEELELPVRPRPGRAPVRCGRSAGRLFQHRHQCLGRHHFFRACR